MRFSCRCIERVCRDFVSTLPIPLLSVSKAWNAINGVYQFGGLNECTLQAARDSCFMIRFTIGSFQAFIQAIHSKRAAAYWIIKVYKGHDSYTLGSTLEIRCREETLARFSIICDASHSYIQSRSSFDTPLACNTYIAEFADKRTGAPALISWSPRCTVFRAVICNLRSTPQSSHPSSPSRAMVSKGVIVLTPRSPERRPTPLPQPYLYKYSLCVRPSSFEQSVNKTTLPSQSDSQDVEEIPRPIFPVSCRAMLDEYSYYSSMYCVSASYMFSSLDILKELVSDHILNEISDLMDPIAKEAQDFEISFTNSESLGTDTSVECDEDGVSNDKDDISEDDTGGDNETEPPLKQAEGGHSIQNTSCTDSKESNKIAQMVSQALKRIENINFGTSKTDRDDQMDSDEIVPVMGEATGEIKETTTSRYIRAMPLHYPMLAIPCPDSKPHDAGQHLMRPSPSISSPSKGQRSSDPSNSCTHNYFEKIEDLIQHFCCLIVAGKTGKK